MQSFVTQKMLIQIFFMQKNACKNKLSKIFGYLVRVHNDERLELCWREGNRQSIQLELQNESLSKVLARL